jgi:hypothetical protein
VSVVLGFRLGRRRVDRGGQREGVCKAKGGADRTSISKAKKRKPDDPDEEVTYINKRNKVFNKKVCLGLDQGVWRSRHTCTAIIKSQSRMARR